MGCYLLCSDGLGRYMSIFVYSLMLLGNALVLFTVVVPRLDTDEQSSILIEYACYAFFWSMMVLSHIFTMCVDPGFIPKDYQYKEEILAAPFNSIKEVETAYLDKDRGTKRRYEGSAGAPASDQSRSKLSSVADDSMQVTNVRNNTS